MNRLKQSHELFFFFAKIFNCKVRHLRYRVVNDPPETDLKRKLRVKNNLTAKQSSFGVEKTLRKPFLLNMFISQTVMF